LIVVVARRMAEIHRVHEQGHITRLFCGFRVLR
jgi:hypothetical protein